MHRLLRQQDQDDGRRIRSCSHICSRINSIRRYHLTIPTIFSWPSLPAPLPPLAHHSPAIFLVGPPENKKRLCSAQTASKRYSGVPPFFSLPKGAAFAKRATRGGAPIRVGKPCGSAFLLASTSTTDRRTALTSERGADDIDHEQAVIALSHGV